MSGVLCLRWNNHTSTFIKTLDNLREKELYCDATIACNGKYFPVHRFVLTTCSEYFEDIFERTQCRHPIIIIKDIEEINIEALLKYMYNGEVNVLQDRLPGLIRAAEALKIRGLAVSEDQPEVKKPQKEKRKSNQTSPLQSKSKKNLNKSQSIATECVDILEDETNDSVTNGTESPFPSINDVDMEQEKEDSGPPPSNAEDSNSNEKENAQEIKSEQSDMFEAVEEDFPVNQPSTEETNNASDNEQSLFVSLLSPNNAHGSEDDSNQMVDNADNSAIPQCSSWTDDTTASNQERVDDEIEAMDVKPLVTFSEGSGGSPSLMFPTKKKSTKSLHSGKHQCPMCSFETKTKAELLRHVSYSHSDFRFSCAICNYKCRTNSLLKKHMLKHTLEKPFLCSLCPYKTARKQHLVRHMKLHTGEKPYSCFLCSYKASRKDRLREHIRKHDQYFENSLVAHNLFASSVGVSSNLDPQEIFQTEPNRGN